MPFCGAAYLENMSVGEEISGGKNLSGSGGQRFSKKGMCISARLVGKALSNTCGEMLLRNGFRKGSGVKKPSWVKALIRKFGSDAEYVLWVKFRRINFKSRF